MKLLRVLSVVALTFALFVPVFGQNRSYFAGVRNASDYAYGINPAAPALVVDSPGISTAGVATTFTVAYGYTTAGDGTQVTPLSTWDPVTISDANGTDTATPSAVSCQTPAILDTCTFTATFTYAHGKGARVISGTFGLAEAAEILSVGVSGTTPYGVLGNFGGRVAVDAKWSQIN